MRNSLILGCVMGLGAGFSLQAQTVSVILNQPAQRDVVIAAGNAFLLERQKPILYDKAAPDPFIGKVNEIIVQAPVSEVPVVKVVISQTELLQNLANSIPARGTAILGGDKFLLLSQKRLKVGESTIINFDGKDYEVWLADVTSTTFTIRRNDLSYTRAVLLAP